MIAPFPVDLQIPQCSPLLAKTKLAQQFSRGLVLRDTCRFDAVQRERAESEWQKNTQCGKHPPLPGVSLSDPVSQGRTLRHTTPDIGNRTPTKQHPIRAAEHQKWIRQIVADFARIPAQSATVSGTRKFI